MGNDAKSSTIFEIKPWDAEIDLKTIEKQVRNISMDGLVWNSSETKPIAFGLHKLYISCTIEDDLVSVYSLQEQIDEFEDVQSVEILQN